MQYSYATIPANHIRLLKPARHTGLDSHSILTFTIETCPIARAPPYTAVSYVWGIASADQEVCLDGCRFAIRQNLWCCLYYLLLSMTNHNIDWTHIWVDAICINQRDEREKSQQVRAMDKVYSNAVAMSAWLGLHRAPNWMQWREVGVKTLESSDWFLFENVLEIAERAYWSRMWIVQELVLAKRIRLHISDWSFDLNDLAWAAKDMLKSEDAEDLRQLLAYVKARDFDTIDTQKPLHELILRFKDCRCSDPRDSVFTLLSLVNEEDKNILGNYIPDYSLTHDAVVVITLHYLQDHYEQIITYGSHALFESLGASSSQLMRRRLLAASTTLCAFSNLRGVGEANFREIPFYEWGHPAEAQPARRRLKDVVRRVAVNVWWLIFCCGTLRYLGGSWVLLRRDIDTTRSEVM